MHQDRCDPPGGDRLVDDDNVVHAAGHSIGLPGPPILEREAILIDPLQPGIEIGTIF
jgi:hypothetical protein